MRCVWSSSLLVSSMFAPRRPLSSLWCPCFSTFQRVVQTRRWPNLSSNTSYLSYLLRALLYATSKEIFSVVCQASDQWYVCFIPLHGPPCWSCMTFSRRHILVDFQFCCFEIWVNLFKDLLMEQLLFEHMLTCFLTSNITCFLLHPSTSSQDG